MSESGHTYSRFQFLSGMVTAMVFCLGIALTLFSGMKVRENELAQAEMEVERQLGVAAEGINRRLQRFAVAVTAGSGVPDNSGKLGVAAWRRFVDPFRLPYGLDGVSALGYSPLTGAAEERWRAPVLRLESGAASTPPLLGVDLMLDAKIAEVVASAVTAREPTLSSQLTLPGDNHEAVLLVMPVYPDGVAPVDKLARRRAALGVVFAVVDLGDLLRSMPNWIETEAGFEVFDGPVMDHPETRIYASDNIVDGSHAHNIEVNFGGRVWRVQLKELAGHADVPNRTRSQLTFAVGGLATILVTLAAAYQVILRRRVELRAREMTGTLRNSEEKYRLVTENIDVGILVVQDGRFCYVNPAVLAIAGRSTEDLIGKDFGGMVYPDDRAMVVDRHVRRSRGEVLEERYDFRILRSDGGVAWVQLSAVPIPWNGRPATLSFLNEINQRKLAEEALRLSEDRYRTVIDAAPLGVLIIRSNRIRFINPSMQRMLGASMADLLNQSSFLDRIHADDRPALERMARSMAARATGSVDEATFRVLGNSGDYVWVEGSTVQVDYEGKASTLAFIHDISGRRALENQLQRALAERETILDASVVGITLLNDQRKVLWSNLAMQEMFGMTAAAGVGLSTEAVYASRQDFKSFGEAVYSEINAGHTYDTELPLKRASGEVFWAHLSGRAVAQGDPSQGSVWVISDISRRKELEEALKRKTAEQDAILQSTQIGITHTTNRIHEFVNQAFAAMVGFDGAELIGQSSLIHFPDEDTWQQLGNEAYPRMATGQDFVGEWKMKRKNGEVFPVLMSGRLIDPQDSARGAIWTVMDITERKQAETDIRAALATQIELNELKSQFVSMTSHEFRTPLATIMSSAELLRYYGDRLPADEKAEVLASVESAVKRMTHMLDGILMIGRADAGKLDFRPMPCRLDALVREVANEAALTGASNGSGLGRLDLVCDCGVGEWLLDEKLLRHILSNLVGNAFKYSPAGGRVGLRVHCDDAWLEFQIADKGIGIPAEDLPHLFETFHRARNVGVIAGTGLGLAIVKRSVALHGGVIDVSSSVGEGTCFTVRLPLLGA